MCCFIIAHQEYVLLSVADVFVVSSPPRLSKRVRKPSVKGTSATNKRPARNRNVSSNPEVTSPGPVINNSVEIHRELQSLREQVELLRRAPVALFTHKSSDSGFRLPVTSAPADGPSLNAPSSVSSRFIVGFLCLVLLIPCSPLLFLSSGLRA